MRRSGRAIHHVVHRTATKNSAHLRKHDLLRVRPAEHRDRKARTGREAHRKHGPVVGLRAGTLQKRTSRRLGRGNALHHIAPLALQLARIGHRGRGGRSRRSNLGRRRARGSGWGGGRRARGHCRCGRGSLPRCARRANSFGTGSVLSPGPSGTYGPSPGSMRSPNFLIRTHVGFPPFGANRRVHCPRILRNNEGDGHRATLLNMCGSSLGRRAHRWAMGLTSSMGSLGTGGRAALNRRCHLLPRKSGGFCPRRRGSLLRRRDGCPGGSGYFIGLGSSSRTGSSRRRGSLSRHGRPGWHGRLGLVRHGRPGWHERLGLVRHGRLRHRPPHAGKRSHSARIKRRRGHTGSNPELQAVNSLGKRFER